MSISSKLDDVNTIYQIFCSDLQVKLQKNATSKSEHHGGLTILIQQSNLNNKIEQKTSKYNYINSS